jgi:hypothetical protein
MQAVHHGIRTDEYRDIRCRQSLEAAADVGGILRLNVDYRKSNRFSARVINGRDELVSLVFGPRNKDNESA